MTRPVLNFKGLMAPVFTFFNDDSDKSLNISLVEEYAFYLKNKGVHGVLVNGTTGEGPVLNVTERKLVAEEWGKASKNYQLHLMVQIGGCALTDVIELAKHAEKQQKIDSVLCLPELYFKPRNISELVGYLKQIAKYCPSKPFLYYHIPMFTGLTLHMPSFCELAEKEIPNFVGLKYTSGDLEMGSACLKAKRNVFLGADTILSGALVLGFDSAIMTTLNICPEFSIKILESIKSGDIDEAKAAQTELSENVKRILLENNGEWVPSMKAEFNRKSTLNAGPVRRIC